MDVAVVFADVRGSTGLAEQLGPAAFAALMNRFYQVANREFTGRGGHIDRLIGDEVMSFFIPLVGPNYRAAAIEGAVATLRSLQDTNGKALLPVGIGVHAGLAFAGKVGSESFHDYTVLGDTVNVAARLRSEAKAGEIVLSEEIFKSVASFYPEAEARVLKLKGREQPMPVRILRPAAA